VSFARKYDEIGLSVHEDPALEAQADHLNPTRKILLDPSPVSFEGEEKVGTQSTTPQPTLLALEESNDSKSLETTEVTEPVDETQNQPLEQTPSTTTIVGEAEPVAANSVDSEDVVKEPELVAANETTGVIASSVVGTTKDDPVPEDQEEQLDLGLTEEPV
jgi:hypothetical protein